MEWVNVKYKLPDSSFRGKDILILVNGHIQICNVMEYGAMYVSDNRFLFDTDGSWCGDKRFAKPTHWLPLPELPKGKNKCT